MELTAIVRWVLQALVLNLGLQELQLQRTNSILSRKGQRYKTMYDNNHTCTTMIICDMLFW